MNSSDLQNISPAPPSLMKSLMAGFDAISNHIGLILFSICLDLLLWFGPRLNIAKVFQPALQSYAALPEMNNQEMFDSLQAFLEAFNLFSVLRTFPVGVPSLMAGRSLQETPLGIPLNWEVSSLGIFIGLWLLLVICGLVIGTFFFAMVAQAAVSNKISWRQTVSQWPWTCLQVLFLMIAWFALFLMAVTPLSCLFSILMVNSIGIGQIALVLAVVIGGLIIWLLIPLVFSPHGIFVNRHVTWISVRKSIRLTRLTLPTTTMLLLTILVLSAGLDLLWNMPAETSWFTLVGIIGHAFVTTSLLAASFVYYRDADHWVQQLLEQTKLSVA